MRYLLLLLALMLTACSPKYRTTYHYVAPQNPQAQNCIHHCKEAFSTCQKICQSNFAICKQKADAVAQKRYTQKMQNYYKALEQYANDMRRYEMERDLFLYDDFYYPYRYGFYRPFYRPVLWGPSPAYTLSKPVKPSLEREKLDAEMKMCRIDCGCTESFDKCYEGCGGKILKKEVCIGNCPK